MHSDNGPHMSYEVGGQLWVKDAPGFAEAITQAHAARQRPRCMCTTEGVEMYVARLAEPHGGYIVKRMPDTGCRHAPDCPSYEPSAELSGLEQFLGNAIVEDPSTGKTTLKLDFPLSKMPARTQTPRGASHRDRLVSDGCKLSLRNLLHYLWEQADLTRWHPGFAGKRHWATVRRHLLAAAAPMVTRNDTLLHKLYLPEAFSVEKRDAIKARRLAQWTPALAQPGRVSQLMLLIGEVKEIVPSRYGFKIVIKHVPDQSFAVQERLYRQLEHHFANELELWGTDDTIRLAIIATFGVSQAGLPCIDTLSLMALTSEWIPIANGYEAHLVRALIHDNRCFIKTQCYNGRKTAEVASAVLTDTDEAVVMAPNAQQTLA